MLFETIQSPVREINKTSIATVLITAILLGSLSYMAYVAAKKEVINNDKNKLK